MLTVALGHSKGAHATEATVLGPFHAPDAPRFELGEDTSGGASGESSFVRAHVRGTDGRLVANAEVDVWKADVEGFYDVQCAGLNSAAGRGVFRTDAAGALHFRGRADGVFDTHRWAGRPVVVGHRTAAVASGTHTFHDPGVRL